MCTEVATPTVSESNQGLLSKTRPMGISVNTLVVPTYFQCPISLELMSDPVTLSTGHTYDRSSIQGWFHAGKSTCPQTRQEVSTKELIPNLTLKSCIRTWKKATGFSRKSAKVPSSPRLLTEQNVKAMLDDISRGVDVLETVKTLKVLAKSSDKNRTLCYEGGALPLLGSILSRNHESDLVCEEALGALAALSANVEVERKLYAVGMSYLSSFSWFLRRGSPDAKVYVARLLECLVVDDDSLPQLGAVDGLIQGLVGLLQEHQVPKAVTSSLRCLYAICLPRENRPRVVEAGAVAGVLEVLPGATREKAEGALAILDLMSRCSEGRRALSKHALCVPVMLKWIASNSNSNSATQHAVKVMHSVLMKSNKPLLLSEAVKCGAISKLLLVIQMHEVQSDTNLKARDVLKLLQARCGADPCVQTIMYS